MTSCAVSCRENQVQMDPTWPESQAQLAEKEDSVEDRNI